MNPSDGIFPGTDPCVRPAGWRPTPLAGPIRKRSHHPRRCPVSLTACPECSRQISTAAFACPGCGYPRPTLDAVPRRPRIDWLVPAIAAGGLLASMVGMGAMRSAMHGSSAHGRAAPVESVRTSEGHRMAAPLPPPPRIADFAIERRMEAHEMDAMEGPPRIPLP